MEKQVSKKEQKILDDLGYVHGHLGALEDMRRHLNEEKEAWMKELSKLTKQLKKVRGV